MIKKYLPIMIAGVLAGVVGPAVGGQVTNFSEADVAWERAGLIDRAVQLPSTDDPIEVVNPQLLSGDPLPAERIAIGVPNDYKPCIAKLANGDLEISAFHHSKVGGLLYEDILLFRSTDGGRTWSDPAVHSELLGREPYLTILGDGTQLMTVHLHKKDHRNTWGYVKAYVHRSTDDGATWTTKLFEPFGAVFTGHSRNVLELSDGSLMMMVCAPYNLGNHNKVYRSTDGGATWTHQAATVSGVPGNYPWPLFMEAVLWQAPSGKIYAIARVASDYFPIEGEPPPPGQGDQFERMILFESDDLGLTWTKGQDLGYYGQMYPSILRLADGRLLLTFTVRAINPPLGVRAVLGEELTDGFAFDFAHDIMMIDTKTPLDKISGGGFGPTVQLDDGTLVTSYSYRDADDMLHLEVVRWQIPEPGTIGLLGLGALGLSGRRKV